MELHGINVPSLRYIPCNQFYPLTPICSSGCGGGCPQSHHVISAAVFEIYLIRDFGLCLDHQVVMYQLYLPDFLRQANTTSIQDIICPKVQTWGEGWPYLQRWRRRVESVLCHDGAVAWGISEKWIFHISILAWLETLYYAYYSSPYILRPCTLPL